MKIDIKKFGTHLLSRPEGRDASLVIRNQFLDKVKSDELIELDFNGVKVLTPSWLDEILQEIYKSMNPKNVTFKNTQNSSVKASIETVTAS